MGLGGVCVNGEVGGRCRRRLLYLRWWWWWWFWDRGVDAGARWLGLGILGWMELALSVVVHLVVDWVWCVLGASMRCVRVRLACEVD